MNPASTFVLVLGDTRFGLRRGVTYTVGRDPACALRVSHPSVGDRHCELRVVDDGVELTDLQTEAGTLVDGARVEQHTLRVGSTLQIGDLEFTLARGAPALGLRRGGHALRHRQHAPFTDIMAEELRRAPWFSLSLLIHAVLLFLLHHLLVTPVEKVADVIPIGRADELPDTDLPEEDFAPNDLQLREEHPPEIELRDDLGENQIDEPEPAADTGPTAEQRPVTENGGAHWGERVTGSANGILGRAGVGGGGFKSKVTEMRRSGLEIMFVFDSTGSMSSVLRATKDRIAHMVEVLHALVPAARMGAVTYRDVDPEEEYLTRAVPLSDDVYRTINFMQVIEADGGGDQPEAVLQGIRAAMQQPWQVRARRVVVLIGDAPAHEHDKDKLDRLLRTFSSDGRSQVHAIVTSVRGRQHLNAEARRSFEDIAGAGQGRCLGFEDEHKILQQVLSLAFGTEYRRNLDQVSDIVRAMRGKVDTRYLDMVEREAVAEILRELRREPVADDLVKALLRTKSLTVANALVSTLSEPEFPERGRQAASHVIQHLLSLDRPPNDPEVGGPISRNSARALELLLRNRM